MLVMARFIKIINLFVVVKVVVVVVVKVLVVVVVKVLVVVIRGKEEDLVSWWILVKT